MDRIWITKQLISELEIERPADRDICRSRPFLSGQFAAARDAAHSMMNSDGDRIAGINIRCLPYENWPNFCSHS